MNSVIRAAIFRDVASQVQPDQDSGNDSNRLTWPCTIGCPGEADKDVWKGELGLAE